MPYNSQIANDLLVTPFDRKAYVEHEISKRLTETEFCQHCYSAPIFQKSETTPVFEDEQVDDTELIMKLKEISEKYYEQKNNYRNFIKVIVLIMIFIAPIYTWSNQITRIINATIKICLFRLIRIRIFF